MTTMTDDINPRLAAMRTEMNRVRAQHQAEMREARAQHQAEMHQRDARHQAELNSLRKRIEHVDGRIDTIILGATGLLVFLFLIFVIIMSITQL